MMGIAQVYGASLPITAAAVIGGAFFGDKLSPLSDTTNAVAMATGVDLFDHINSMLYTTVPAAILAAMVYAYLSTGFSPTAADGVDPLANVQLLQDDLKTLFNFNPILLLPLIVVIWGAIKRKPIFLTLMASVILAAILALIFQDFGIEAIIKSVNKGFSLDMAPAAIDTKSKALSILNRGGLYSLINATVICLLFFAYIGTLDVLDAIQVTVKRMMSSLKKKTHTVASTLAATIFTDMLTSNVFAATFIVAETFGKKYDEMGINRKVLSRSIEDASTMLESVFPWTAAGIMMSGILGVEVLDYAPYMFMSWFNITIAFFYAFTGIACFYNKEEKLV
jgi:NhaC family Na+:H+ antiporter